MNVAPVASLSLKIQKLSVSHDQKVMTLLPPMGSALWTSINESFLEPKFDNSSPSVTRDKEICQSHVIMR